MISIIVLALSRCCSQMLLLIIAFYRRWLSPLTGQQCRFYPTCSHYAELAIIQHGPIKGALLGLWRICRCSPFCAGGIDLPPAQFCSRSHIKHSFSLSSQNDLNDGL